MRPLLYFGAILLLFSLSACAEKDVENNTETPLRPVRYQTISYAAGAGQYTYSGVAQADKLSKLSFRVGGTVRTVNIKLGDRVRKGQLIATIDPTDYGIQAEQATASEKGAEANLQSAETQLINARSTYIRIEKLYENNSVPLSDYEQAKSAYEGAQSSYDAAQTQVTSAKKQSQSARNQVSYTRLLAPFDGIITAVNIEANELVGSGTPIAEISSASKPEVNIGIPENNISNVKNGQKVSIHFSALPDLSFAGTVSEVSYAAGNSPTFPAIIRIDNPSSDIRPGMAAEVTFQNTKEGKPSSLVCPVSALGKDMESTFVYVLEKQDQEEYIVKKQPVEVGEITAEGFVLKDGLQEGQLVATAGLKSLLNGMKVKLLEE